jgi:hypothetical protein
MASVYLGIQIDLVPRVDETLEQATHQSQCWTVTGGQATALHANPQAFDNCFVFAFFILWFCFCCLDFFFFFQRSV